ncbi:hypothetical protein MYCTH_2312204 [Thermothelomyces thermophilus ATCC 42464]|uniref:Pentatricopeptide repeat domain-containing protein n=1 Tax=Thermothelomyces thermophilus (strain ATCC 42464 / BCRC 31852 / DSM 1799) TaxID=573729 RepID=G2QQ65_THET4|nr:uncharacterized protein MYCTH_2312204 [Thermothelomyces thermophilus ATCC 42464]AEO61728.1 hypothetical protein MYCTH_2312204 [Thermothelomyces thermophilus ATCC 42464]
MLGLWSMAAQLRACHCRACLRATRTAARQVTTSATGTASNPRRRKVLASDVFTACYSAIMATAAVIDAGRKDRRRRELDRKIAEAKSRLACLLEESAGRDLAKLTESPYPDVPYSRPLEKADVLNDICKLDADFLRDLQQKRKDRLIAAQHVRTMLGLSWNPTLPETRKTTLAKCEEVVMAEKGRNLDRREPQTETHMAKITDMVTDLVDRLMAEAWWSSEIEAPGSHPALNSPDSASTMIRMLRSDGYPSYAHPDLDPAATIEQRERLNDVNVSILSDWVPPLRERYAAKICYNFLVCGVPPGIQNYNMLILGFSLLGEHNLSQAVVDSFLYLSHMKPSEATYLCLLHHYRLKGDIVGFQGVIKRMFGYDPRGIGLMRRTADYVERRPELQAWAATQDVAVVSGHYVQRAPFTHNVAEAMMEGLIDFGMLREGAKLLAVCLREQWTISKDLLWRLFHSCLTLLDTTAAKLVVRALLDNIDQASLLLLGPDPVGPGSVRQLRHLLNIWQATVLPGNESTQEQGPQVGNLTGEVEKAKLNHLAAAVWIREAWHHTSMMCWWLRRAERKLSDHSVPLLERLDMVLSVLNFAAERPRLELEKSEHIQRVAKMDWLMAQTVSMDFHIRSAETVICKALAKQMPRQLQTRSHFKSTIPLEQRISRALLYTTPGTVEYHVATLFNLSNELELQIKRALINALPKTYAQGLQQTQNDSGDVSFGRIVAYFKHYLAGLKDLQTKEAETASRPDPFARLFEALPKPISFWKRKAASAAPSPGHIGW